MTEPSDIAALVARLKDACGYILPVRIVETPDYAEIYFGESQTQAMTMEPNSFNALNDIPDVLALIERQASEIKVLWTTIEQLRDDDSYMRGLKDNKLECDLLRIALHEAIVSPKGIVPASAEPFYDQNHPVIFAALSGKAGS